jgi:ABC-2 type transport system ATP-binding protein
MPARCDGPGVQSTLAQQQFGYMPDERGLYPAMRVAEQIAYSGQLGRLSAGEATAAARWSASA